MKQLFFGLCLLVFLSACDSKRIYEQNIELQNNTWNAAQKVKFEVTISDTVSGNNVLINVRHAGYYPYSNLFLFINTTFPDGKTTRDTVECPLADEKGKWLGKGLGDLWDTQILFKRNVRFSQSGNYKFEFEQAMRIEELPGIMDVGLRIEKP
ncbi:MAG: Gliding motility lipoprotein GldH [Bacteroidia bacterium]|nr:Gliding motility lipoprotein GldH [Bacteroidia bacterium]